jgi:FdhD protein
MKLPRRRRFGWAVYNGSSGSMRTPHSFRPSTEIEVKRFDGSSCASVPDSIAVEEPLEIRIVHGDAASRATKSISVTMRTPGNDAELAVGFLLTEGVIRDAGDVQSVRTSSTGSEDSAARNLSGDARDRIDLSAREAPNIVTVELMPELEIPMATLERNFYTASSCGVCGKASLLALRTVCPPRRENRFSIDPQVLYRLPGRLLSAQGIFGQTGGLHAAALFNAQGELDSSREDVGRHNAVDKLLGAALLADRVPLRDRILLLSGRAGFELLQKALMGGIPMVAAMGAPSSLALEVAKEFDITLVGFLSGERFNVYHGARRISARHQ